jgi:hypothetical protein
MPKQTHTRAPLAGVAATGSLLAAVAAGTLIVGGLLGFGAFPGAAEERPAAPLRVAPALPGARALATIAAAPRPRAASRRAAPRAAPRHAAARRDPRAPRRQGGRFPKPSHPPAQAAGTAVPAASSPARRGPQESVAAPRPPAPAAAALAPAAQAARDTTASAAGAAETVIPQAAGPIQAAGTAVAGAVEHADHAVGATLSGPGR